MPQAPDTAIRVENLSKTYRMWSTPASRLWVPLLHRASRWLRPLGWLSRRLEAAAQSRLHLHQALKPLSFTLGRGEALGIIGHNGSGKSTLLQIVVGVLAPTTGRVEVNGRVAALLELGSGFNPELTGRENVRVNAAILGLSPRQIEARMEDIIAFADIGGFIDEPVKTYSSGMAVRLAFAVQVHTDPDILIVDEALAVGDAAFQAKAMDRIDQILQRGTTLLFVGHDLNAVKAFCHRAMLLQRGEVTMAGLPDEVITEYLHQVHRKALAASAPAAAARMATQVGGYGVEGARVLSATVNGVAHAELRYEAPIELVLILELGPGPEAPALILDLMDGKGLQLTGRRIPLPPQAQSTRLEVRVSFRAGFQMGVYRFRTRVVDAPRLEQTLVLSRQEGLASFEVVDDSRERFTGLFPVPMEIAVAGAVGE